MSEKPEPADEPRAKQGRVASLVTKPATWVIGVVLVALTATFSSGLQDLFTGLLPEGWNEPGSGIDLVDVRRQPMSGRVLIPRPESARFDDLSDALTKVNDPEWEAANEWYAVNRVTWEVTLVGRHRDPVVITDLRPVRTGPCTETLQRGVLVEDIPQGEGTKTELKTEIDAKVPRLTVAEGGAAYFDGGTITLAKGETVILSIEATSAGPTCRWTLEADYVDNGKREAMTITAPGGQPFAITGDTEKPHEVTWSVLCPRRGLKPAEVSLPSAPSDCL